ncbi:type IV pilus assembly protein PilW [Halopseudomonas litoralis]|uniref:Type IV pilus assembly protein PilW n=1 Tax=Halopseudomonas litoralis TaxID=797277 RepID=A0A1H1L942_9GAMM|nr:prepilin-type N-terminal cleavage/methylation domain-containing protein [Halopseudomonas litoralis]SDR71016.1 type IV pilus assembly protein PilW [Halopseudomonas litoralis]
MITHGLGQRWRGFGLVELMIAMTLGLILVLGVSQIFLAGKQSFVVQQHTAALQENARFVLSRISRDLRQAGMFGCLDPARLPAATRSQMPAGFDTPVSFANDVLKLITAVPVHDRVTVTATRRAADYGAQWLIATNCLDELRIAAGSNGLQVEPGDFVIPVRQVEYRLDQHRVQIRINGNGNFEVLIDDVAGFDMQFGLAASAADRVVDGRYVGAVAAADSERIRSVRLALSLSDNPANPADGQIRVQQYTLVTALRNRLN